MASLAFQYADLYLVSLLLTREEVGQYGAALRIQALVIAVPTVWGIAAMPRFARHPHQSKTELVYWSLALTASGLLIGLAGIFFSLPLISFLFGSKYRAATIILPLLGWSAAGIFASSGPVTWLTITNRQYYILLALVVADFTGLGLYLLLAGIFKWGLEGVAISRCATSWLLCCLYLAFCRSKPGRNLPD
ncbi:MAG TPA: hypothetical protein VH186_00005 [Chloroflexia bacterium]|nr:hypothetical protein [Chloroflexia bacterium]